MRHAPSDRDASEDLSEVDSVSVREDWTARHARTCARSDSRNVRPTDPGDDWTARHNRTRHT